LVRLEYISNHDAILYEDDAITLLSAALHDATLTTRTSRSVARISQLGEPKTTRDTFF